MKFSEWLAEQDDDVQDMITSHVSGLTSALDSERRDRKALQKQMKNLSAEAESGSEMQKQLDRMSADLAASNGRSSFYEAANGAGVKNLRLAHIAATETGLIDDDGVVNMDGLKESYPELFVSESPGTPMVPRGNAGDGAGGGTPPAKKADMDTLIRSSAGIQ